MRSQGPTSQPPALNWMRQHGRRLGPEGRAMTLEEAISYALQEAGG